MLNEPVEITLLVTTQLEALQIPYLVGGSVASIVYGEYRSTNDADVLAAIQGHHILPLVHALSGSFFIQADDIADAVRHAATRPDPAHARPSFAVLHRDTAFKVDVFVASGRPFERAELARRVYEVVAIEPEQRAYIATAEDVILAKLEWYALGNQVSNQQWRDIQAMLKVQRRSLDLAYMHAWAPQLGIKELLERALTEAGLGSDSGG